MWTTCRLKKPFCVIWYFCCRIDDEIDDTEVEEAQEEKIKWEVKLECEQISKKVRLSWIIANRARNECKKFMRGPGGLITVSIWNIVNLHQGNLAILL